MLALKTFNKIVSLAPKASTPLLIQIAGFKDFKPPKVYDGIEIPKKPKLRMMLKVPNYNNIRPPRMQKKLILMRGPDVEHNKQLVHKQFGIIALQGGRIKYPHIEMARLSIGRKLDTDRMFAVWRIPDPWQPLHKKGIGIRLGGGKGSIDHYATPIRAGRVILEIGGNCEFDEVKSMLNHVAVNLPFKAMAVSQEMLDKMENKKILDKKRNLNHFTKQYVMQNNLNGCHKWLGKYDHWWFGEYL